MSPWARAYLFLSLGGWVLFIALGALFVVACRDYGVWRTLLGIVLLATGGWLFWRV